MSAQYVKPYVKRGKNDAADAEAICEAVTRPTMRFVGIKSPEQSNALRAHCAEFGVVAPIGRNGIEQLLDVIADPTDERVPADARFCLEMLAAQLQIVKEQILENDRRIMASARETELGRRLMEIPGVGPLLASAIVATVPDPAIFRSGRNLAGRCRVPEPRLRRVRHRVRGAPGAPAAVHPQPARLRVVRGRRGASRAPEASGLRPGHPVPVGGRTRPRSAATAGGQHAAGTAAGDALEAGHGLPAGVHVRAARGRVLGAHQARQPVALTDAPAAVRPAA